MFIAKTVNKWGQDDEWSDPTTIAAATVLEKLSRITSKIDSATGMLV